MSTAAYLCPACGHVERGYQSWSWGGVTLDESTCSLILKDGTSLRMFPRQVAILSLLMRRPGMSFRAETLIEVADIASSISLRTSISKLRRIIRPVGLDITVARTGAYQLVERRPS